MTSLISQKSENRWFAFKPLSFYLLPFIFLFIFLPSPSAVHAATVTLAWDENSDENVVGYLVHYGTSSRSYQYSVDVENNYSCTISGLNEGTTYYFAATAYNNQKKESILSEELAHTIPNSPLPPSPPSLDTDGDGILDNDEITLYGTDPANSDTDGDGITDGQELKYWGDNWNTDSDGDGIFNLLDPDSDNDGFTDGQELASGFDPSNSASKLEIVKIWLEAESGDLYAPMTAASDFNASDGQYVWVPFGNGNVGDPQQEAGYARYVFNASVAGNYIIWGRTLAIHGGADSFFISVDDNGYSKWHVQNSSDWIWDQAISVYLEAGQHSLLVKQREQGTKIDKILITNNSDYIPAGSGEGN